ncbi:DUF3696 domain-containing protein [Brachybacterium paraconglomeratum]|uniref:DUF3696 domain-containing protein n=1 Tax=Brachybacterium paraconglomeratum TaxID=173362 RepID=UPI003FD2DF06
MNNPHKSWIIHNFKGVESANLPLEGLSVLSGVNSAGKSSLTQSLLLLAQSSKDDVVLNGPLARFGAAKDVINEATVSTEFKWGSQRIQYRSDGSTPRHDIFVEISLSAPRAVERMPGTALVVSELKVWRNEKLVLSASSSRVSAATLDANNPNMVWGDSLLRVKLIDGKEAAPRTFVAFSGLYPSAILYKWDRKALAKRMLSVFQEYTSGEERAGTWLAREFVFSIESLMEASLGSRTRQTRRRDRDLAILTRLASPNRDSSTPEESDVDLEEIFLRIAGNIAKNDIVAVPVEGRYVYSFGYLGMNDEEDLVIPESHLVAWQDMAAGFAELRELSQKIRYIGPLREEPQVLSPTGGRTGTIPAGIKGEYTADLLYRSREEIVNYLAPDGNQRREVLRDAVGEWARWLGVGDSIQVIDEGKLGRGILVNVKGKSRDLTTIGVGVSQLLPVITLVMAAPRNAVVILEQPELHLHPAIQSRLADFFSTARPDLAIVVETHSEYLITRLRMLRVSGKLRVSDASFLFARAGVNGSTIEPLAIGGLGDINEWPEGFFDTQEAEERHLLGALTAKAKAQR